jgi:hypothetical protein
MDVQLPGKSVKEIPELYNERFPGITPKDIAELSSNSKKFDYLWKLQLQTMPPRSHHC